MSLGDGAVDLVVAQGDRSRSSPAPTVRRRAWRPSFGRRSPCPSTRRRRSCRPAIRTAASTRSSRPTPTTSTVANAPSARWSTSSQQERLLVVVGPSGIGKSSVVKAGLLPALADGAIAGSETWLVTEMVPGRAPFERLAAALGRVATVAPPDVAGELAASVRSLDDVARQVLPDGTELVVVVDQFEELFTQTVDDGERRAFLRMLVDIATARRGVVRLVATLRADYFDRPLGYPGFGDAIKGRTVALGAMTGAELADAVRLPAAGVGVEIEPALVDRITAEAAAAARRPAARATHDGRAVRPADTNLITLAAFDDAGGLAGAIGRRAEAIYQASTINAATPPQPVFLRLVNVSEEHDDTRRRVRRTELEQVGITADDLQAVLDEYGRHRLLTFDRDPASRTPTVELAHESLLTEWERFAGWVDDAREDLLARRRLESAAHDWIELRDGPQLPLPRRPARAGRVLGGQLADSSSTDDERRFLAASRAKVDRDQVVRTRGGGVGSSRSARRRRGRGDGVAAIAVVQRRNADQQADADDGAGELAGLSRLAVDEDPERAILLGLAAIERTDEPSTELMSALHRATQSKRLTSGSEDVMNALHRPEPGRIVARRRPFGPHRLPAHRDGVRQHRRRRHHGRRGQRYGLAFDPTGSTVAVAHENPRINQCPPSSSSTRVPVGQSVRSRVRPATTAAPAVRPDRSLVRGNPKSTPGVNAVVWDVDAGGTPRSFGPAYDLELGRRRHIDRRRKRHTAEGLRHRHGSTDFVRSTRRRGWSTGISRSTRPESSPHSYRRSPDASTSSTWRPANSEARSTSRPAVSRGSAPTGATWPSRARTAWFVSTTPMTSSRANGSPEPRDADPDLLRSRRLSPGVGGTGEIRTWDISPTGPPACSQFRDLGGPGRSSRGGGRRIGRVRDRRTRTPETSVRFTAST